MPKYHLSMANTRSLPSHARGSASWVVLAVVASAGAITSAVIWAMHLTASSAGVPEYSKAVAVSAPTPEPGGRDAIAQMFGAPAAASTAGGREIEGVQLLGIVSAGRGAGVALFSVDGAPPVRVRAGAKLRDGVTLTEVQPRQVLLERGGKTFEFVLIKQPMPQGAVPQTGAPGTSGNDRK